MKQIAAFLLGAAVLIALTIYAGAGTVVKTLVTLGFEGLLLIAAIHLPVVALLGLAWWIVGRDLPDAKKRKFAWARLVRDGAAEVLPFSQIGGFVLGVRALQLTGVSALRGALSMSVDVVLELFAKLPYFAAGLLALFWLVPAAHISGALPLALSLTALAVFLCWIFRRSLRGALETMAMAIARRWPNLGSEEETKPFFESLFSDKRRLWSAFALHVFCWVTGVAETWVIFRLIGHPMPWGKSFAIDSLVSGLRTFGFLVPAAAGVQEGSYVLICALFGIAPATAIAVSLSRRARDLALGVPTLAAWQFLEMSNSSRVRQDEPRRQSRLVGAGAERAPENSSQSSSPSPPA